MDVRASTSKLLVGSGVCRIDCICGVAGFDGVVLSILV
jgi:hypothetical protein